MLGLKLNDVSKTGPRQMNMVNKLKYPSTEAEWKSII